MLLTGESGTGKDLAAKVIHYGSSRATQPFMNITCSALTGRGCDKLMPAVLDVYGRWNIRVSTSALNRWLRDAVENHPPPLASGRRVKLRYITQVKARPPTFAAFVSRPEALADSYRRYLVNGLREEFGLDGVPIRLFMRKGKNPYAKK